MVIVKMYMIVVYKCQEENTLWCFILVKFLYTDVVPFLICLNNKKFRIRYRVNAKRSEKESS